MKRDWFRHDGLTEQEATELIHLYTARAVPTQKQLSSDYLTWSVMALLPVGNRAPRVDRTYEQRIWQ